MFAAIGHDPRNSLVTDVLATDDKGYLKVEAPSTYTEISGVFAAGDIVDHTYRQAIIAAGSGRAAAIDAERWLAGTDVLSELAGGGYGSTAEHMAAVTS